MSDMMNVDQDIMDMFDLKGTANVPAPIEGEEDLRVEKDYPVAPTAKDVVVVTREQRNSDAQTDYDFARRTMHHSIENGSKALSDLVYFASNSGGPEAFKQVATVMDSLSKSTKQLLDLQAQMNNAEGKINVGANKQQAQTINNNTTIVEGGSEASKYAGMTREQAMEARRKEREERAEEKVVN